MDSTTATMPDVFYSSALKMRAHRSRAPFVNRIKVDWDPAWLAQDAFEYNPKLAIASLGLCMASYVNKPSNGYCYAKETMANFGFTDVDMSSYDHRTEEDPSDFDVCENLVAYIFARCDIPLPGGKHAPGIAVIIRGTSPTIEWNSNANLADTAAQDGLLDGVRYHEGFRIAELELIDSLKGYMDKHGIDQSEARFLIAGHSRGACIANMLGAHLNEAEDYGLAVKPGHAFAYTFASSGTTLREDANDPKRFGNVFNLVHPEDFIPRVPLASWGFKRFGTNCYLPSIATNHALFAKTRDAMYALFEMISDTTQLPFHGFEATNAFVRHANNLCGSLRDYYHKRHIGGGGSYTFREYFELFTNQCAQHGLAKMKVQRKLLSASAGAYSQFLDYFVEHEVLKMTIPYTHAAESYMSRLKVLDRMEIGPDEWAKPDCQRIIAYGPVDIEVQTAEGNVVGRINEGDIDKSLFKEADSVAMAKDSRTDAKMAWVPVNAGYKVLIGRASKDRGESEPLDIHCTSSLQACEGDVIAEDSHVIHELSIGASREWRHAAPEIPTLDENAANIGMALADAAAKSPTCNVEVEVEGSADAVGVNDANPHDIVCVQAYDDGRARFEGWVEARTGDIVSTSKKLVVHADKYASLIARFDK